MEWSCLTKVITFSMEFLSDIFSVRETVRFVQFIMELPNIHFDFYFKIQNLSNLPLIQND